ncbi:receptor-like protein EIX1 [Magnolia sinica]|uniref:receptor-like protein EIX1 n=1 Tax=Magnolia sinica TaxID=86752 RepID=UPI0026593025|nr:receptor-like protein EIX1 [Magnolia sinica]
MTSLVVLDLSQNKISGTIPSSLGNCVCLEALDLSRNHLSGVLPKSLGLLTGLQSMHLSENSLTGQIPSSFRNFTILKTLNLRENNFSGNILAWIGNSFPPLRILRLRSNKFIGKIPQQISNLTSLQVLDAAHNYLSGSIPQGFENLIGMENEQMTNYILHYGEAVQGHYYEENLIVSMRGLVLNYSKTISLLTCIDLSSNHLSGKIPQVLTILLGLRGLNLSGNNFTGKIPDKIGRLASLEALDFSRNQLSGIIPPSISSLTFLSRLNLSYNDFSGKIPSGNQLQTLDDPYIYFGNDGLCGPPLTKHCNGDEMFPGQCPVEATNKLAFADDSNFSLIKTSCIALLATKIWLLATKIFVAKTCPLSRTVDPAGAPTRPASASTPFSSIISRKLLCLAYKSELGCQARPFDSVSLLSQFVLAIWQLSGAYEVLVVPGQVLSFEISASVASRLRPCL